tara:strand:- start:191 stop:1435 length:1245 start_codon:yes stop_codon:yes gene_type:complete
MTNIFTNVLQLAGSLSADARDLGSTHLDKKLYLLEESKARTKVGGSANISSTALYIKVVLDVNKHVSKHLGGNADNDGTIHDPNATNNADDAYSLSAINILSTHFSAIKSGTTNNHHYSQNVIGGAETTPVAGDDDFWRTSNGDDDAPVAKVYYKLPQPKNAANQLAAKNLKMGHINFKKGTDSLGAFAVTVNVNIPDATENAYTVSDPQVSGDNVSGSIDDIITNAQYAYVSKSDNSGTTQADMTPANRKLDAKFGADSRRQDDATGSDNAWIATTGEAVDNLEDKLSVEVEASEVKQAYQGELDNLKASLEINNKVLTSWSINVDVINPDTDSLLSKFGRFAKSNETANAPIDSNIFASGDRIVVSDETDAQFGPKTANIDFKATELTAAGGAKGQATTIVSDNLIAILEQA